MAAAGVSFATIGLAASSAALIVRAAERPKVLTLTVLIGLVQLFALSKAAGRYVERMATHRVVLRAMGRLRGRVARLVEPLVPVGLGPRIADAVALICDDVERAQDLLVAIAVPWTAAMFAGIAGLIVAGLVVPSSAVVLAVLVIVLGGVLPSIAARLGARAAREEEHARSTMRAAIDDAVQSGDELMGIGATQWVLDRVERAEDQLDRVRRRAGWRRGAIQAVATLLSAVAIIVVTWFSVNAVSTHQLTRSFVAVPALTLMAAGELLVGLGALNFGLRADVDALDRLDALSNAVPPVAEPEIVTHDVADALDVSATNVVVTYGTRVVVQHDDVTASPGEFVVLRGPSGCGKTTLARSLARFVDPTQGVVRLGDVDERLLRSDQVRARVGLVDDEPHVFATTLAGNLRVADPEASDERLLSALRDAGLGPLLRTMPFGLETVLRGDHELSGGERRRLAVARELLSGRPIAVFDEPTEGLESSLADALLEQLAARYREGAVVLVSHRDADAHHATKVVTLGAGVR
jgi:ATP-binding cassette subfamily C protein CydCD